MNVVMIGSGYVGLVSGACFAEFGANVTCVDVDKSKIEQLVAGKIPIYEPGLDGLVARNVAAGRLAFTTEYDPAIGNADLVFIAVGTPTRRGDGHADLVYVYEAARQIDRPREHEGAAQRAAYFELCKTLLQGVEVRVGLLEIGTDFRRFLACAPHSRPASYSIAAL